MMKNKIIIPFLDIKPELKYQTTSIITASYYLHVTSIYLFYDIDGVTAKKNLMTVILN